MFSGFDEKTGQEDLVFLAVNAHWIAKQLVLPSLPNGYVWKIAAIPGTCCIRHFPGTICRLQDRLFCWESDLLSYLQA